MSCRGHRHRALAVRGFANETCRWQGSGHRLRAARSASGREGRRRPNWRRACDAMSDGPSNRSMPCLDQSEPVVSRPASKQPSRGPDIASVPKAAEELHQPLLLAVWFGFRFDCLQAQPVRSALRATIGPRPDAAPRALTAGLFVSRSFFNRLDWHSHFSATSVRQSHRGTDEQPDQSRLVTDQERSSPPGAPDVAEDRRRRGDPVNDRCGGNGGNGSPQTLSVFVFFGEGVRRTVAGVAGPASCPGLVCWRGRRNHHRTKNGHEHGASGAATHDQADSRDASNRFP